SDTRERKILSHIAAQWRRLANLRTKRKRKSITSQAAASRLSSGQKARLGLQPVADDGSGSLAIIGPHLQTTRAFWMILAPRSTSSQLMARLKQSSKQF